MYKIKRVQRSSSVFVLAILLFLSPLLFLVAESRAILFLPLRPVSRILACWMFCYRPLKRIAT